jgi:hypothetical protein
LHEHAFYLLGVIAGLAIGEGFTNVIPRLVTPPSGTPSWVLWLEQYRLLVATLVTVRFYVGAGHYFDTVHKNNTDAFPVRNYYLDFISGLFHFTIVFAWFTTITIHSAAPWSHASTFLKLTFLVMLYDLLWLWTSWSQSTYFEIKKWAVINAMNAAAALIIIFVLRDGFDLADWVKLECWVLSSVVAVSLADLWELATDRDVFETQLSKVFSFKKRS